MQADKVGSETMLAQIVTMVAEAQRSRAPVQRLADLVSSYFVPAVIAAAVIAFAAWAAWGPPPSFGYGIVAAVAVLIIACPCALGLATPMAIMVGVGRGARAGVLIRNAEALERLEKVDTLVIDKTGTLTQGKPKVVAVAGANGFGEARSASSRSRAGTRQRTSVGGGDLGRSQCPRSGYCRSLDLQFARGHGCARNDRGPPPHPGQCQAARGVRDRDRGFGGPGDSISRRGRDDDFRRHRRQGRGPDRHRRSDQAIPRQTPSAP